jgi:DNA-binding transcriptional MerR regulator
VPGDGGAVRIGEFARRVGVSAELLRAWERRYGLLQPIRSAGGFRLYTAEDARRVGRMRAALEAGMSAAEAARAACEPQPGAENLLAGGRDRMLTAITAYDESELHAVLDEGLAAFGLETLLRELLMPVLQEVGRRWAEGLLEISHEHFASNLIRGRLLSLARLWGRGAGPLALLACPPGEEHDLSLIAFGLVLRSHGWRILFLGADTPIETVLQTSRATSPALTVIAAFRPERLDEHVPALLELAETTPLALGGPGARPELCAELGARGLGADLVSAAAEVAGR